MGGKGIRKLDQYRMANFSQERDQGSGGFI